MADIFSRLNFLKNFFMDPCDAPFTAYAESFLPAFLQAAIIWYMPDPENFLFNSAKPSKALGRRRSQRKGKTIGKFGRFKKRGVIRRFIAFDIDDWIGRKLQGLTNFADRRIGGREWALWISYGVLERIFFWFFVFDLVSDFLYNWLSLVEEGEYCQSQRSMVCLREAPNGALIGAQGWIGCYCPVILKQRGITSGLASVAVPSGVTMQVSGASTFTDSFGRAVTYETRIRDQFGHVYSESSFTADPGQPVQAVANTAVLGPRLIFFEHRVIGGTGSYQATFSVMGQDFRNA